MHEGKDKGSSFWNITYRFQARNITQDYPNGAE